VLQDDAVGYSNIPMLSGHAYYVNEKGAGKQFSTAEIPEKIGTSFRGPLRDASPYWHTLLRKTGVQNPTYGERARSNDNESAA